MSDQPGELPPSTPSGLPAEATGVRPGPVSTALKVFSAALSGALVVLLFVAIIPKVTEFGSIGDVLRSMHPLTVVFLFVIAVIIRVVLAAAYAVLTPGLSLWRSLIAREASSAVSNVIPGPSGTAAQYVILRSWGVSLERFARATVAVSVSTDVLIFAAPGAMFVGWVLRGMPAAKGGEHTWAFGLAAVIVSVVSITLVGAVAGSIGFAHLLGRVGQACVNPFRRLFGKPSIADWPERTAELRADLIEELHRRGGQLMACVMSGYLLNGLLLVACLWACGITEEEMSLTLGLLLYSIGRIATIVQITPGGVGVVEIAYTAVYVSVLGESAHDSVVAGVLVYRALTYLLPIVTGAFAYLIWRIMRRTELRHEAAGEPA